MLEVKHPFLYDYPNEVEVTYRLDTNETNGIIARLFTEPYDVHELILFPGSLPAQFPGTEEGLKKAIVNGNLWYERVVASLLRRCKGEPDKPRKFDTMGVLYQENIRVIIEEGGSNDTRDVMSYDDLQAMIDNNYAIDLSAIPKEVVRKEW